MKSLLAILAAGVSLIAQVPEYTPDGKLLRPVNYREWIYLSSGLDMTYGATRSSGESAFDNVFVSPAAYREFQATGKWPEKTMFILEVRAASSHGSINKAGYFQSDVKAIEVEVKDSSRFPAEHWAFFGFGGESGPPASAAKAIPPGSMCHACHSKNGAVDNTFVQFYPTLHESARKNGTLKGDPLRAPTP